jgi:hypothetical protein
MKLPLPEDPAERKKIFFLAGIFAMGFLFLFVQFALLPYFARIRANKDRVAELDGLLWQAERDIRQAEPNRIRNRENVQRILDISEKHRHILRPSLGNYLLVAESILHRTAEQASITIEGIREASGPPPAQEPGRTTQGPTLWPYAVNLTLQAGLHDLTRFVHILQKQNPYLAITSLVVQGGEPNTPPGVHSINMTIQWPVWSDPDHPNRLSAELLADGEHS